jgi:hypothetical protein
MMFNTILNFDYRDLLNLQLVMRKVLTIPVLILILFSGITVNLAFHYCGGHLADKKISLSGVLASCGMETENNDDQTTIKSICCENSFSSYTFNNIYIPSVPVKSIHEVQEFPVTDIILSTVAEESFFSGVLPVKPPGTFSPSIVELDVICILRI